MRWIRGRKWAKGATGNGHRRTAKTMEGRDEEEEEEEEEEETMMMMMPREGGDKKGGNGYEKEEGVMVRGEQGKRQR